MIADQDASAGVRATSEVLRSFYEDHDAYKGTKINTNAITNVH